EVYATYDIADDGLEGKLRFELPLANGQYQVRLHFVEPLFEQAGQRVFDVYLQDSLVRNDFDIVASAGGKLIATTLTLPFVAADGRGLSVELRNQTTELALLSAIEVFQGSLTAPPATAVIEASLDQGVTWQIVAADVPLDQYGHGQFGWQVPTAWETSGNTAHVRVRVADVGTDVSDAPFLITNGAAAFYVNIAGDSGSSDNEYATAAGDNRASGKSPAAPMASLWALLRSYDLEPGDVIYVDSGRYLEPDTLRIVAEDSGISIQGPVQIGHKAILENRNSSPWYGGGLVQFGDVVSLLNGVNGLVANAPIYDFRLTSSEIYGGTVAGATISAHRARFDHNRVHGLGGQGIWVSGTEIVIEHNEVFGSSLGIVANTIASGANDESGSYVRENLVHDNSVVGIQASLAPGAVEHNTVFGHVINNAIGIHVSGGVARMNRVYANARGIEAYGLANVEHNQVFDNVVGITGNYFNGTIAQNQIFSNQVAIVLETAHFADSTLAIANNLIYGNSDRAIQIRDATGARLVNNTIRHSAGDAIDLVQNAARISLANNVIWVEAGFALRIADDSQTDFASDYNDFYLGAANSGMLGKWNGTDLAQLSDWQSATTQDAASLLADPRFIDPDGADNVLGYDSPRGSDGSADDNFHLSRESLLIDRGASSSVAPTDFADRPRSDDPATPNLGEAIDGDPGFVDIGAFEFQGSRADTTPPYVVRTSAVLVGTLPQQRTVIHVLFSEAIDPIDANAAANYELREAGANNLLGDADDLVVPVTPSYEPGSLLVVLEPVDGNVNFYQGRFQVLVSGNSTIHDLSGWKLDGDGDGLEGGNYVQANQPPRLSPPTDIDVPEQQPISVRLT
ncbi:MAG: right-handed parallel beta-helix repeat-containing protein, partial [Planctomycetia bacterium]|nr:right-handed parallel beta-helix repeat-containing protein [Planctomycetia bacterium]